MCDHMCTFDLKSGYHHVDVCELSQKYLGFEWKGAYNVFTVLSFGLASACYVFSKLLRPIETEEEDGETEEEDGETEEEEGGMEEEDGETEEEDGYITRQFQEYVLHGLISFIISLKSYPYGHLET